mgnify:CR=1 FL=1
MNTMNLVCLLGASLLIAVVFGGIGFLVGGPAWCGYLGTGAFFLSFFFLVVFQVAGDDEPQSFMPGRRKSIQ